MNSGAPREKNNQGAGPQYSFLVKVREFEELKGKQWSKFKSEIGSY
jgi:hypothetical protein